MHLRAIILMLAATSALTACADEAVRRDYLYKPAYCLASGLANLGGKDCLPESLKENVAAVATAKLKDAASPVPSEEMRVYYTSDQRLGMSYDIARILFAPERQLTRNSIAMSLEAADLIEPAPLADKSCGAVDARKQIVSEVEAHITPTMINRDTADFIAETYTDLQITELYRVAKAGGKLDAVATAPFIMPDPKDAGKTVNVKPKADRELGSIISYTTSRTASRLIRENRKAIEAAIATTSARVRDEHCPPPPPPATEESAPVVGPVAPPAEVQE